MSIRDTVKWLARDLSKVQDVIVPEHGERKAKRYTSTPDQLVGVEVLPEYELILEALQAACPALFVTGKAGTGKSSPPPVCWDANLLTTSVQEESSP